VIEDRRSMVGSIVAAMAFIRDNGDAVLPLYFLNLMAFVAVVAVYAAIAPGAGTTGLRMWIGFAVGQLLIVGRLWVKLTFWASEASLFQGRLAHAGHVAKAEPTWPDSPAAEAITS
jgi:hypothetical protein